MCVASQSFGTRIPFGMLEDVKLNFVGSYGSRAQMAMAFEFNDEFSRILATKMEFYSNDSSADKIKAINQQIDLVKTQMMANLEKVVERGEKISLLKEKTESLKTESTTFKMRATQMKRVFWWKNIKLWVILGILLVVPLALALSLSWMFLRSFAFPPHTASWLPTLFLPSFAKDHSSLSASKVPRSLCKSS